MFDPKDIEVQLFRPSSHGNNTWLPANGVTVMHIPTSIGVTVDSERSQHANKEKALQLLESLVIAIKAQDHYEQTFQQPTHPANRVQMIKDTRQQTGYGLKEAKEAVDRFGNVEQAVAYLNGLNAHLKADYSCMYGDMCRCGGDTQGVRQGCSSYTGEQL